MQISQRSPASPPSGWHVVDRSEGSIAPDVTSDSSQIGQRLLDQNIRLIAVRHGQSETNAKAEHEGVGILCGQVDSPLSAKGQEQAQQAAERIYEQLGGDKWLLETALNPLKIPVLYASPLSRAHTTAATTAQLLSDKASAMVEAGRLSPQAAANLKSALEPKVDSRILEMSYGDCELAPLPQVYNQLPAFMHNWDGYNGKGVDFLTRFPGGESRSDVVSRVHSFLDDIASRDGGRTVVMFAHLETISATQTDLGQSPLVDGRTHVEAGKIKNATPMLLVG